jgi:hypothetical protein
VRSNQTRSLAAARPQGSGAKTVIHQLELDAASGHPGVRAATV